MNKGFLLIELAIYFLSFAIPSTVLYCAIFEDIKPIQYQQSKE